MKINKMITRGLPLLVVSGLGLWGCGETNTQGKPDEVNKVDSGFTTPTPAEGFWTEYESIGPDWYDYDFGTHTVAPSALIFASELADGRADFLRITNYTNDQGASGYFTFEVAKGNEAPKTVSTSTNVKKKPVCLSFAKQDFVDCKTGGEDIDLFIAALPRPVPDYGFGVMNPTFFCVPKEGRKFYALKGDKWDDIDRTHKPSELVKDRLKDAYQNGSESRVAGALRSDKIYAVSTVTRSDANLQPLQMVTWKMQQDGTFDVLCGAIDKIKPLESATPTTFKIEPQKGKSYAIRLCEGEVEEVTMPLGLWSYSVNTSGQVVANGDLYLSVDDSGKESLVLGPMSVSWAIGEAKSYTTLEQTKAFDSKKDGVVKVGQ